MVILHVVKMEVYNCRANMLKVWSLKFDCFLLLSSLFPVFFFFVLYGSFSYLDKEVGFIVSFKLRFQRALLRQIWFCW